MVDFSKLKKIISKNNSERIQQALAITEAIRQLAVIQECLEISLGIKLDNNIASDAVNEVAREWNLTYSTVSSKCTTQMDMSLKDFENLVSDAVNDRSKIITLKNTLSKYASQNNYKADCTAIDMYFENF
ncbi:MAG: hypothetical protein SPE43_08930 [Ruminococcus sp.]|nr:hypothetical protein [Oscillospiraceae bacterium]MDY4414472.1 hypothetical protein [Ruminococcus sp.]